MKKFLIINPFGIGDVLFTTPVISAIKDNYPDAFIGYWCNNRVKAIFKDDPNINKIFPLSRGDLKSIFKNSTLRGIRELAGLISGIKRERFDIALDFSMDYRYSLLSKLSGVKKRLGFNYKNRGRFLTQSMGLCGYVDRHVVEYYLDLLNPLGLKTKKRNLYLHLPEDSKLKGRLILKQEAVCDGDLVVGIAPGAGASWGRQACLKHWPEASYAQLADRIIADFNAKVLILGDLAERPIAERVLGAMKNKAADLTGRLSLEELPGVINNLSLLITNDGGPLHIAVALGKKTISFFGPTDPGVYGPYPPDGINHIVLRKSLECSPCYADFRLKPCPRSRACLDMVTVNEAFNAADGLIG